MRDITYRPAQAHSEEILPSTPSTAQSLDSPLSTRFHRVLRALNRWGGIVVGVLEGKQADITPLMPTPTIRQRITRLPLAATAKHRVRAGSKIVFEKGRATAANTKRRLKTPAGKVAAVNLAALLALFAYIQFQNKPATAEATRNVGSALASVQHYLPVVGSTTPVTAFQETSVTQASQHTPLDVWVTPWNISQVATTPSTYSSFSAFWATVNSDGAGISLKSALNPWQNFTKALNGQPTYLTISGDPNFTYLTLTTPNTQQTFITNSLNLLNQYNFSGLDIDFEGLGSENRDLFTDFVRNLATALHAENKQLAVTLEARIANQVPMDWHNVGQIADEVRIMGYDYHSQTTDQPGPIAPLGWIKEVADYAVQNITPNKIVMGLGDYGYDWTAPTDANPSWTGTGVSFAQAQSLSQQYKVPIVQSTGIDSRGYDIGVAPNFTYTDSNGQEHQVWFEDSASLQQKVDLLNQYSLKGLIFWSVGLDDQTFWNNQSN